MREIIISLIVLITCSCNQSDIKESKMKQAKIIEMVLWNSKEGVSPENTKKSITKLNDFVKEQPGFIARKTAMAEDGRFLDIVYWTDLVSAKTASERAMKNEELIAIFSLIDEKKMIFQHFEIFNSID